MYFHDLCNSLKEYFSYINDVFFRINTQQRRARNCGHRLCLAFRFIFRLFLLYYFAFRFIIYVCFMIFPLLIVISPYFKTMILNFFLILRLADYVLWMRNFRYQNLCSACRLLNSSRNRNWTRPMFRLLTLRIALKKRSLFPRSFSMFVL